MSSVNSRERVLKAVDFKKPDQVPNGCYNLAVPPGPRCEALRRLFERYPPDFAEASGMARTLEWGSSWQKGMYKDGWGVVRRNLQDGIIGQPVSHPLADWENFRTYQFPDPLDGMEDIEESVRKADRDKYLLAGGGGVWHMLHALRGFENVMMDIIQGRRELIALIDRLVDFNLKRLKPILELNPDGVMFGDDWGMQRRLMIRLEQWRQYFRPAYKRMFDFVRREGKHIFFHSDGCVMDILQDLHEIGVNAVNIQVSLMGVENIRSKFGGKLCIAADVDRQYTLPFGTTGEVRNLVRDIILGFKKLAGGLILYGEIGPDVSIENAESMLKALQDYGKHV